MVEVNGPKQVKFEKDGTIHEGIFMGSEQRNIEDNETHKIKPVTAYQFASYDFERERLAGDEFEFLGQADLKKKLTPALVGKFVIVQRTDERISTGNGQMVVFKVAASEQNYLGR